MSESRQSRTAAAKAKRAASRKSFFDHVLRTYGITEMEYRAMYRAQGGRCYVCRKADGTSRRLGVDHNHLTGEVRGLVCTGSLSANTCNRVIAIYSREQLLRAVEMLSDPPPARAVLAAMRSGVADPEIPSVVGKESFRLHEIGIPE
jgi:hypothetical protein